MKNFIKKWQNYSRGKSKIIKSDRLAYLFLFMISLAFFAPVLISAKVPLPADALVGAHVPWNQVEWEGYPAGIPIKNQEITDAISQFYPWKSLAGEYWRKGKAPLWNPYIFSGTPFFATLHSASIYPLNVFYLFFSDINAWTLLVYSQILLSLVFMFLFLKSLHSDRFSAVLGALAFAFSGYMIAWLEFATGPHAGLWLPMLLYLLQKDSQLKRKSFKFVFFVPFVFFFVFTAGDFQVPLYISGIYLAFSFYLSYLRKSKKLFLRYLFVYAFGILLSLPQLFSTYGLFTNSIRGEDLYIKDYFFGLLHWEKLANFVWPDFFGNVVTRNYWGKYGFHEYLAFAGVITLVFAFYSLITKKLAKEKFFIFLFVISLLFLFPTPLGFLPYKLNIPALSTSSASRLIFVFDFSLATLASYGFCKWRKSNNTNKLLKTTNFFLLITVTIGAVILLTIYFIEANLQGVSSPKMVANLKVALKNMIPATLILFFLFFLNIFLHFKKVFERINLFRIKDMTYYFAKKKFVSFLIIFLLTFEMLWFANKNTPFSKREFVFPETKTITFLKNQSPPFRISGPGIPLNYFMQYDLSSAEGYDPIYPLSSGLWFSAVNHDNLDFPSRRYGQIHKYDSPLISFANVQFVIDYKKNIYGEVSERGSFQKSLMSGNFEIVSREGEVVVFENKSVLPAVWLSNNIAVEPDIKKQLEILSDPESVEEKKILLFDFEDATRGPNLDIPLKYSVENYQRDLNEISFDVNTSHEAYLFLSETYYPGWQAYLDSEKADISRANLIFQSIFVPKGKHKVRFIYCPKSFKITTSIAIISFVLLVIIYVRDKNSRRIARERSS